MPNAIELIVDGYVRLNNRRALDDLRMQRRKLAVDLKARTGFDFRPTIQQGRKEVPALLFNDFPEAHPARSLPFLNVF